MAAFVTEIIVRGIISVTMGTGEGELGSALTTELRSFSIVKLAVRAFHLLLPP
jgi:hypothetical protein